MLIEGLEDVWCVD